MRIAITTPTGHIGRGVVEALLETEHDLVLLCRDASKVRDFTERGATAVVGQLEDAEYVSRATKGVDALFWLTPPKFDAPDFRAYQNKLGDIAAGAVRKNKIKRVVHLSSYGAQHAQGVGPIGGLHDIENKLNAAAKEVGGTVTHLRPAAFFENFFMALGSIRADGAIYMPVPGDIKIAMIATRDIAPVAAQALTDKAWDKVKVQELLGPRDLSHNEVAKIIGDAAGKPVKHVTVPAEAALAAFKGMGASESVAKTYVEMYGAIPKGLLAPEKPRDKKSTTPTRFEDFAKQALAPALKG
jgi:uncharacterized protein YbjT (DUF2867 family)